MIFEQDSIVFQILDVFFLDQKCKKIHNSNRNFDALSFRFEADTMIEYSKEKLHLTDNCITFFPANIDYTRTTNKEKLIVIHFKTFNYNTQDIEVFKPEAPDKYAALFQEILNCWSNKSIGYKHHASAILNCILEELFRDTISDNNPQSSFYLSLKYMKENFCDKDFSLQTAAKKSMMSDTYFRKLFKQEFNISPKKYIINCRIKYATSLIITGYYTIQEISDLCGYKDCKHFSVEFKKVMGVSPSKYKYDLNSFQGNQKNVEI